MSKKILTIPNVLTISRLIFLVPFIFIALDSPTTGAWLAGVLAFTDFLDGWIARRFNQTSDLGRILDPVSDRALFLITFVVFIATESIPIWFVIVIGLREVLIAIGTIIVFFKKRARLDVAKSGKISAFAAMAASPGWVFATHSSGLAHLLWTCFAILCTAVAIPTGYYSLFEYFKEYRLFEPK